MAGVLNINSYGQLYRQHALTPSAKAATYHHHLSTENDPVASSTTVVVEEGFARPRNNFGKVRMMIVSTDETGTQTMNQPPVLKGN